MQRNANVQSSAPMLGGGRNCKIVIAVNAIEALQLPLMKI